MVRLPKWVLVVLALALVVALAPSVVAAELVKGKVKSVGASGKEITITDNANEDLLIQVGDHARIFTGGREKGQLSDLRPGDMVSVIFEKSGDRRTASGLLLNKGANANAELGEGTVKSVTPDQNQFTMTDLNGKDWAFNVANDARVRISDKDSRFADLKKGEKIFVIFEKKGDQRVVHEICSVPGIGSK
jgi:Cu/Ag efflux protein CusF